MLTFSNPLFCHHTGGTWFRVMTSILHKINWVKIKSLHVYEIRSDVSKLKCHILSKYLIMLSTCYSDVFNIEIYCRYLIHFLKILRSWPQNNYHQSLTPTIPASVLRVFFLITVISLKFLWLNIKHNYIYLSNLLTITEQRPFGLNKNNLTEFSLLSNLPDF